MAEHIVAGPGPRGEPAQLVCQAHAGCTWRRDLAGPMRHDDPILLALFRLHLRETEAVTPSMMGHPKRARIVFGR